MLAETLDEFHAAYMASTAPRRRRRARLVAASLGLLFIGACLSIPKWLPTIEKGGATIDWVTGGTVGGGRGGP